MESNSTNLRTLGYLALLNSIFRSRSRSFVGDQVLINVSCSSTVLELKKLLAAEISGDLRTEVFSENIHASLGSSSVP